MATPDAKHVSKRAGSHATLDGKEDRGSKTQRMQSKLLTIALDKVKTPAIKAHIVPEPFHPGSDVLAHPLLAVVQIGGCNIVLLGLVAASAPKGGVVVADVGLVPGQSPSKLVPLAIFLQHIRPTLHASSACLLHAHKTLWSRDVNLHSNG